jgi:hypothetical protein
LVTPGSRKPRFLCSFLPIYFCQKITIPYLKGYKKVGIKATCKMLVK